jgi:drug/metabolite transporter (DMT)-like permease
MLHRPSRLAIAGALALVLLGTFWAFGGYNGMSLAGGMAVTLGVAAAAALGIGLMSVILEGRRSRRDEAVRRSPPADS